MFTAAGMQPIPAPRALTTAEVGHVVEEFRAAARAAMAAGADGVEIHAANGYLLHQFLSSNANRRDDRYGGSVDNRIRLTVEVAAGVAEEIGAGRTGLQISPGNPFNDIAEDDVTELYPALLNALAPLGLAYLNVAYSDPDDRLLRDLRRLWPHALVLNRGDADMLSRVRYIEDGSADVITVGKLALANPDLVERLKAGAALNPPDPATFYGGDRRGYVDYPTLAGYTSAAR
jgi:N-ethylmaleimide reductase